MRSLLLSSLLFASLWGSPIGGIAIMVKNFPITMYDVQKEMEQSKTTVQQSADTLIRKKLEDLEATEKKITVTPAEVQEEMERMAKQNNVSLEVFLSTMQTTRGLSEATLKEKISENIKGQKLYSSIAFAKMGQPTPSEEAEYYKLHLDEFSLPDHYQVVTYVATSPELLQGKMNDPLSTNPEVVSKEETIPSKGINPQLIGLLNKIKVGKFGPIIPNGENKFMTFYMKDKPNMVTEPLDAVRVQVDNMIVGEKRNQVLNDHFTRLRLSADIKVLRLP